MSSHLDTIFRISKLQNDRLWCVLQARFEQQLTLQEIADTLLGGISRERVRQIEINALIKFSKQHECFDPIFEILEKAATSLLVDSFPRDWNNAIKWVVNTLESAGIQESSPDNAQRLVLLIRAHVGRKQANQRIFDVIQAWPNVAYYFCRIDPPIKEHPRVRREIEERDKNSRRLSYRELAEIVLTNAGKPLHWREIADAAYKIGRRTSFNTAALYNALQMDSERFTRVGRGIYALSKWGMEPVSPYTDIIAKVLREHGINLPSDAIFHRVNKIRKIKRGTLIMYLDLHPRFYRSIDGTYGLRIWLPPRDEQTLRTPERLIEDSKSLERVEKAQSRGYDIKSILEQDKLVL